MVRLTALTGLNFAPSDSPATKPSATNVSNLIANWYKEAYRVIYGIGHYSADDSTDTLTVIITSEFSAHLDMILSDLCNKWHVAGTQLNGQEQPMPSLSVPDDVKSIWQDLRIQKAGTIVKTTPIYGESAQHQW